jgi:hypothetical protein
MSIPPDHQPFTSPDIQHGQHPPARAAFAGLRSLRRFAQPQQGPPPQSYWQSPATATKQKNGLAIVALVVASLAQLIGLAGFVSQMFMGAMFGGLASFVGGYSPSASSMLGTALR